MKRVIMILAAVCSVALLISADADAKRLGGGRSFGAPRDTVTQRQAMPPASASPAQPAAPASAATPRVNPTPVPSAAQPAWKRWMGPIAGIAAGLGIAALMSHMGLSEGFGNILMIALLVIAAVFVVRLLLSRRKPQEGALQYRGAELAGAGAGAAGRTTPQPPLFGGAGGTTAAVAEVAKPYPPGFEPEPFLRQAKLNFARLQGAYDTADSSTLHDVMTPEMFAEVNKDLAARATHHPTEIVTLNAEMVEVVTEGNAHWASVRFTGLLREDNAPTPEPFDEVWNLTKAASGETGWLLAGIQQM
ncbi:MAG: Tim44-like domain-containing protein [Casimicrobiaceae bacterium]